MKATGLTAFYYWIFSFFLLQMIGLNWKNVPLSAFGLFSLCVAVAGALSSTGPSIMLPKMEKNEVEKR